MHQYNGYAVIDYASAAPYVKIDMNPVVNGENRGLVYKDAIIFSPHKFVGGPECPGVLVAKKHMFKNFVPENPGGGTVFFVTDKDHRYLKKAYEREEGGTPQIIG
jgi:selenocysteine lyase/cysteine desulfurase